MGERKRRRRLWLWILALCVFLLFVVFPLFGLWISPPNGGKPLAAAAGLPHPAVIAHRGASYDAPEGTRLAYLLALLMGADYLECDVQVTKDGELVVFHDGDLQRTTDVGQKFPERANEGVRSFYLAELKQLDAGKWFNEKFPDRARAAFVGLRILTFDEFIDFAEQGTNRPGLYIETKIPKENPKEDPGLEEKIVSVLTRRGWIADGSPVVTALQPAGASVKVGLGKGRVVFQSFNEGSLSKLGREAPGVPRVLLVLREEVGESGWRSQLDRARRLGCVGVGPHGKNAFWWHTGPAHDAGLVVHPYTINLWWQVLLMRWCGADGFFTDRPDLGLRMTGRAESIDTEALLSSIGCAKRPAAPRRK